MAASPAVVGGTNLDELERNLEALLGGGGGGGSEEFNMFRSGSAPPTVEGSRTAFNNMFAVGSNRHVGGWSTAGGGGALLSEEEVLSHPEYLSYYYKHEYLNPRLPPPGISKEDWRAAQRLRQPGDWRRQGDDGVVENSSFSFQQRMRDGAEMGLEAGRYAERRGLWRDAATGWANAGKNKPIGLQGTEIGAGRKSFADGIQRDSRHQPYIDGHRSRPGSRGAIDHVSSVVAAGESGIEGSPELYGLHSNTTFPNLLRVQSLGSSNSFAAATGSSLPRSTAPESELIRRTPSPCLPPVGVRMDNKNKSFEAGAVSYISDDCDATATLSALSHLNVSGIRRAESESNGNYLPNSTTSDHTNSILDESSDARQYLNQQKLFHDVNNESSDNLDYTALRNSTNTLSDVNVLAANIQSGIPMHSSHANANKRSSSTDSAVDALLYRNAESRQIDNSIYNAKSYVGGDFPNTLHSKEAEPINLFRNQRVQGFHAPVMDSMYAQYLQTSEPALRAAAAASLSHYTGRNYVDSANLDMKNYEKAYLEVLFAQQKLNYGAPYMGKSTGLSSNYGVDLGYGLGVPSSFSKGFAPSPFQSRTKLRERQMRSPSSELWNSGNGLADGNYGLSLLDEFKNNKSRSFELLDIVGHVHEFSSDQYGSRFIQQKLEAASVEEKNKIFPEILSEARSLMIDVFGNYVIQKFFEHGTESQRRELAALLEGHVLQLSLQMYGCRVIQKAIEVVDVDQQTQMALELDGSIIECVRDQNGNHVIQKCIECIPQDKIHFIISAFYGHVVELSMHPYGCRVIQRVLEHCDDRNIQSAMMEEIMQVVCTLAQDQYGNYVIQHVLQHGKPEERSAIIGNLSGQIVKFSQQKFASNVVEKCLTYGTADERQILINEMLGSTDENEPLQAMMKDQFGNYVVQKVLETCDDWNRELILSRIKVHLNALKRYTYGKHIVARVEKLVTAGERRGGTSSLLSG